MKFSVWQLVKFLMSLCGTAILFVAFTAWTAGNRGVEDWVSTVAHGQSTSDYRWNWSLSDNKIELGDSVLLNVRVYDVTGRFDHGGVSVSFPSLTSRTGSDTEHISPEGDVAVGSTSGGVSEVTFFERGDEIFSASDRRMDAEHLLVESHNPSWSSSSDRTVRLWITPRQTGRFEVLMRTWLCRNDWSDCLRGPSNPDTEDQQDYGVRRLTIDVGAAAKPDLTFDGDPTVNDDPSPSEFTVGDTVTIRANVTNIGSGSAGSSELAYHIGRSSPDRLFDTNRVRSLNSNESDRESVTYTFTNNDIGIQYFRLVTDHDSEDRRTERVQQLRPDRTLPGQRLYPTTGGVGSLSDDEGRAWRLSLPGCEGPRCHRQLRSRWRVRLLPVSDQSYRVRQRAHVVRGGCDRRFDLGRRRPGQFPRTRR